MDAETLRFLLTLLGLGVVGIVAALAWARMRDRARAQALLVPPDRQIPGFDADRVRPAYVTEAAALVLPAGAAATDLDSSERARLLTETGRQQPLLRCGWVDDRFVTDRTSRLAVLPGAHVAVLAEGAGSWRELLPLLQRARGARLVLVAASLSKDVVTTLAVNETQQLLAVCPVVCGDTGRLAALADALGTTPLTRSDLQAGWVPRLGRVACWVSSADASWQLDEDLEVDRPSTSTSA